MRTTYRISLYRYCQFRTSGTLSWALVLSLKNEIFMTVSIYKTIAVHLRYRLTKVRRPVWMQASPEASALSFPCSLALVSNRPAVALAPQAFSLRACLQLTSKESAVFLPRRSYFSDDPCPRSCPLVFCGYQSPVASVQESASDANGTSNKPVRQPTRECNCNQQPWVRPDRRSRSDHIPGSVFRARRRVCAALPTRKICTVMLSLLPDASAS